MPTTCPRLQSPALLRSLLCDRGRRGGSRSPRLRHRIVPTFNAEAEGISVEHLIDRLLKDAPKKEESDVRGCPRNENQGAQWPPLPTT